MKIKKPTIYVFEIQLAGATVPVWRIIEISQKFTLQELACAILVAMGWEGSHLYEFNIGEYRYCSFGEDILYNEDIAENRIGLARDVKLSSLALQIGDSFQFIYDLGDHWEHKVTLKGMGSKEPMWGLPFCSAGCMNCPPEDMGGILSYNALIAFRLHKTPIDFYREMEQFFADYPPYDTPHVSSVTFKAHFKSMMKQYSE
jgi:hypothetical protein